MHSLKALVSSLCLIVILSIKCSVNLSCPCKDEKLCNPVVKEYEQEVFVFSLRKDTWKKYDWNKITTIVAFNRNQYDEQMMCYAHSRQVRVVSLAAFFPPQNLTNPLDIEVWAQIVTQDVIDRHLDGTNLDLEFAVGHNEKWINGLNFLTAELNKTMRRFVPRAQITWDVAWSPDGIDGRWYDFLTLSKLSDFLVVMSYDERSQIYGDCIAWANSAFNNTAHGINRYLNIGVKADKLVLAVPWYGYRYPCIGMLKDMCFIKNVPFRDANCSDAAGQEVNYQTIMTDFLNKSLTGLKWSESAKSPYFTYQDVNSEQSFQVWFDNPPSLKLKYDFASKLGLRGVGMWNADVFSYDDSPADLKMRNQMWSALP